MQGRDSTSEVSHTLAGRYCSPRSESPSRRASSFRSTAMIPGTCNLRGGGKARNQMEIMSLRVHAAVADPKNRLVV